MKHPGEVRALSPRARTVLRDFEVLVYRLFGVHASLRLSGISVPGTPLDAGRPLLCETIRKDPRGRMHCDASEAAACAAAVSGPSFSRCHAGLWQFAVPLRHRGRTEGHLFCSPVAPAAEPGGETAGRVLAATGPLVHDSGPLNHRAISWFARQIPVLDPVRRRALAALTREFYGGFRAALEAGGLPHGFRFYHVPVRASGDREAWLSFLWAGPGWEPREPRAAGWATQRGRSLLLWARPSACRVLLPGRTIEVPRDRLILIPAGRRYRVEAEPGRPPYNFWMIFTSSVDLGGLALQPFTPRGPARSLLDEVMRRAAADARFTYSGEGKMKMLELLLTLRTARGTRGPGPGSARPRPGPDAVVDRARRFLDARLYERVTLGDVARAVGLNEHGLCRRFTAEMGRSPMAWWRARRVEEARALLRDTGLPVKTVSARLGFSGLPQFSRVFRSATGLSPRRFRVGLREVNK